jgi:hypothetical protein
VNLRQFDRQVQTLLVTQTLLEGDTAGSRRRAGQQVERERPETEHVEADPVGLGDLVGDEPVLPTLAGVDRQALGLVPRCVITTG